MGIIIILELQVKIVICHCLINENKLIFAFLDAICEAEAIIYYYLVFHAISFFLNFLNSLNYENFIIRR